jgi:PAS domain S-box-containing protein
VVDQSGIILARSRLHQEYVGTLATPDLQENTRGEEGTWHGSTADGQRVFAAFARTELADWRVPVGVRESDLAAPLTRSMWVLAATGLSLLILSVVLATLLGRRVTKSMRVLRDQAAALGRGEPVAPARTYLSETAEVGGALAEAAAKLQAREDALRRQTRALTIVNETGAAIAAEHDLTKVVQQVTDAGRELTGAEFGAFFYTTLSDTGESMMLYTLSGAEPEDFAGYPNPRPTAVFRPTFQGEGVVRSEDIFADPRYGKNPPFNGLPAGHLPIRSYLAVPVISRSGEVLGGLFYGHGEPGIFRSEHETRLLGIAGHAATAIDNARLFDAHGTEIAERRRAEQDLQALNATLEQRVAEAVAEQKLMADVFETTDAMMSVADHDLRLLAFNRSYAEEILRLGGAAPRIGVRIPELYARVPELAASAEADWRRAAEGETFSVTQEVTDPDGVLRWYESRFEPLYDRDGQLLGSYQYATEVTDRIRDQRRAEAAEAARREADALYRAYFQNSSEGLFVISPREGKFVLEEVNAADREILEKIGLDLEIGKPIEDQLPEDMAAAITENYRRVVSSGTVQRYHESAPAAGKTMHFETVLVPVQDESGETVRIMGSTRDMTAQVQAEEALLHSQKMDAMGQLTGGVAHDFNNLLTPIMGSLDRLQRRQVGDARDQKLVLGALQSAERAQLLVQRLLAFARRQPLQPSAVHVSEVVRGMEELVRSTTGPQITVEVDVEPGLPAALADPNQLEMAILNLAVNARDAMPEGGTLSLSTTDQIVAGEAHPSGVSPGRYICLEVKDTGTGMDAATLARAVEPFYSTKGVGRGTGLGLSMVHGLAAQLGGALTIDSRLGEGTCIQLWLPVAGSEAPVAATSARAPHPHPRSQQGLVLLVDDEDLVRSVTADMLSDLGYTVVEAGSAEDALQQVEAGLEPDLLVTDHLMPGLTGSDLAHRLQLRQPGLGVLIVSGYAETLGLAPELPRLTKPFRQTDLYEVLQRITKGAADT